VRHGHADKAGNIVFDDICGLKVKALEKDEGDKLAPKRGPERKAATVIVRDPKRFTKEQECTEVPFSESFDYMACSVYISTFKSGIRKNDVVPTKDFQYSEALSGGSITDMELL
jgi:hypothetical protein